MAPNDAKEWAFTRYLQDIYIGKNAKFPPNMWGGIMESGQRHTTNVCESWHRPNVYDFFSVFSMANKRAMVNSQTKDAIAILNASKLTKAVQTLKANFD